MHFSKIVSKVILSFMALALILPTAVKAAEFNDAQRAEIQKMFKEFLANSGEDVLTSVNDYQAELAAKQQAEAGEKAKDFLANLEKEKNLPMAGNPKGDITLVEFFDYNCGYCSKALEEIQAVIKDDDNVKIVFMDMPILGPASVEAAKWSLAANNQNKYFEYHAAVMNHKGNKDEASLERIAKDLDLDIKKMKKDKESDDIAKTIEKRVTAAQEIGIRGTPGFILAGNVHPGYMPAAQIKSLIEAARKK